MPITQDRLISMIATADSLLAIIDENANLVRAYCQSPLPGRVTEFLSRVEDPETKTILTDLFVAFGNLLSTFANTAVPQSLRHSIWMEQAHFRKHRHPNETIAKYRQITRARKQELAYAEHETRVHNEILKTLVQTAQAHPEAEPSPEALGRGSGAETPAAAAQAAQAQAADANANANARFTPTAPKLSEEERAARLAAELASGAASLGGFKIDDTETLEQTRDYWREAREIMTETEWKRKVPDGLFSPEDFEAIASKKKPKKTKTSEKAKPILPPMSELYQLPPDGGKLF